MNTDARIKNYTEAAKQMAAGKFDVSVPADGDDALAELGGALSTLGVSLESRFAEMRALVRVTEEINRGVLLEEVLDHVYTSFRKVIPYDRIGFSLLEESPDGETLVRAVWARSDFSDQQISKGYCAPLRGSSLETILRTGEPRLLNDLEAYLEQNPQSESTRRIVAEGVRASLTCPLINNGKAVGFVFFSSGKKLAFADAHKAFFLEVAGQLSLILEKTRLYEELLALSQLRSKFLGIAAHDLRNPLGVIQGSCSLLRDGGVGELNDLQRELISSMEHTCSDMLQLINELLDASAIEAGRLELRREPVDVAVMMQRVHREMVLLAERKSIGVALELTQNLPTLSADESKIRQVLGNLISNALKFSASGKQVKLGVEAQSDSVRFSVQDEGAGIPQQECEGLFGDYQRASVLPTGGEKSTGLGLAIVRRIVEAHGGKVGVESTVGVGSCFYFELPTSFSEGE